MGLYNRKGIWYSLFYVDGKRYRVSTDVEVAGPQNKKRAKEIAHDKQAEIEQNGEPQPRKKPPVLRDMITQFLDWAKLDTRTARKTKIYYQSGCRLILATPLAGVRCDQVTASDIRATRFHDSAYSTNCALRTLRRAYNWALEKEIVRRRVKIELMDAPSRELMVKPEDESRLLATLQHASDNRRYKKRPASPLPDVFRLMLDTGMRPSEVVRMQIENINWTTACYFNLRGKTKLARRWVPLSDRCIALLRARCGERVEGWVFPSKHSPSGHVELTGLQKLFRHVARQLGLPEGLKLYCARHTFGTVAMAETRDPGLVRKAMGHADLKTTMDYLHPDVMKVKEVIDRRNESKADLLAAATITATLQ